MNSKRESESLKIAMVGQKRLSREGGVEIVVAELATRMVKLGHEVTLYNRKGKHVLDGKVKHKKIENYQGIKVKEVITIDKKGFAAMTSSFFGSIAILFSKNEIVHYHAEGPCAMIPIIKFFSKKKIIVTIHGLDWDRAKWGGFATKYIKFGEKMAAKYADEIIVLSESIKQYFKTTYNRDANFIPNGVNKPEILKPSIIEKEFNLQKDSYILFLGRIVPEKGIHYLIEAYKKIDTDKKLVIAGGASDTNKYYNEIKELSKDNGNILFTGFVQGDKLGELYSNAYLYVLPSDLEGMPLSLLEAMSYKNCCVSSNIPECASVLNNYGITFKKSDVGNLKNKLQQLLDNESEVNRYKKSSQQYVLDNYNWDDITAKTLMLYRIGKRK